MVPGSRLAFQSLQNMLNDLAQWRNEVLLGFVEFVQREVSDLQQALLEMCSWRVILLLSTWKQCELSAHHNAAAAKVRLTTRMSAPRCCTY